ncbi:MAG: ABC transporter permease [Chloroflexota bacterium]|nr:ABC transporter permease [Chloroflexota bacterium]MDE2942288.1 ABC transporter permease [Chloroflexota bacterium]MDE3266997.1 ABC transporter permease [Chloroflexota bacterium]
MLQYTLRRLWLGSLTAVLVSIMVFVIMRIAPGDVVDVILGGEDAFYSEETADLLREQLGLNAPLPVQYFTWMRDFVTLQWGVSLVDSKPIWGQIRQKMPLTLELSILTLVISVVLGIPSGIFMALKQDTATDYIIRIGSLLGLSIPNFWIATMIILGGVLYFDWSPRLEYVSIWVNPVDNLWMFFWPAFALGTSSMATKARMMRSTMLEVLRQDYIRTAHAKGLRYYIVVYRHAMKNAMLPVVTIIGIQIAGILGGSVILETIFLLPGMGQYLVYSLSRWDYPVVQTLVLFFAAWIIVTNLIVDLTYGWLDPRIRFD